MNSLPTFFLDKKSNKKVKANTIAPRVLPGQRTRRLRYLEKSLLYTGDSTGLRFVLCEATGVAVFSLNRIYYQILLLPRKKGAGKSF